MNRFGVAIWRLCFQLKLAILLIITAMLLSSACLIFPKPPSAPPPPPPPSNQPPIIKSLTAEKETLASTESQIVCEAADADGDALTYWWTVNGGTIKGEGKSITWGAPDTGGTYTIKVMVKDGKGGEATESLNITVTTRPNTPPIITGLTKDGSPPDEENKIRNWRTVTIECIAKDQDGDKLNYIWAATGGKIQGVGNKVGWTAPGVAGDYTVKVIVTDGRGGKAESSMTFKVLCCGGV